jgi:hypothetical protein
MSSQIERLGEKIPKIGNKVVRCKNHCTGIINDPREGRIPRCILFDLQGSQEAVGCIIVGINPGRMKNNCNELNHYLINKKRLSYNTLLDLWNSSDKEHSYYKFLRMFVNKIGLKGPILWTELVKCEKSSAKSYIPLQTFRTCTNKFLTKEIKHTPIDWPIIAIGREAHKALSYLYPSRSILGIPHPTASKGNFSNLFDDKKLENPLKLDIQNKIGFFLNNEGSELWLS